MSDRFFIADLPPELVEAINKLPPEQRKTFDAAVTRKLRELMPLVAKAADQAEQLAATRT